MELMTPLKKPGCMAKLRNSKGFSLIEMAIVLVIIGIIIGAIIKGQDLIANSHAKKVISAVSTVRNLTETFRDRNGRFPGDEGKNGIIGDQPAVAAAAGPPIVLAVDEEQTAPTSAIAEIAATMDNAPTNPIVVGSTSFWVYVGSTTAGTVPVDRNAILICGAVDCATVFTTDQVEIIKAMDTAFDGTADSGLGNFRAVTAAITLQPAAPLVVGTRTAASFSGAGVVSAPNTTTPAAGVPWAVGPLAAVWLFDKSY